MRINQDNKSMDMEARDINYILPAYVRSYLFHSKNEMPEKIIFPMFPSVTVQGKDIPIEYVPPLDAIAVEIAQDGTDVAEVTPEDELALDEKDDRVKEIKEELTPAPEEASPARAAFAEHIAGELATGTDATGSEYPEPEAEQSKDAEPEPTTPPPPAPSIGDDATRRTAEFNAAIKPNRQPKQPPGGDIGPGSPLSDMQARDRRDQVRTARDLVDEPDINEAEEKEYEKPITRDGEGKPVVDDKKEV